MRAAIISFTKTLAKELAPKIQVNSVSPGFVYTKNYEKIRDESKERFLKSTYLGRWIKAEEIAQAFLYLATADAMIGENLVVDAGFSLKKG